MSCGEGSRGWSFAGARTGGAGRLPDLIAEFAAERASIAVDENLLAQGIIDTMGFLERVGFLGKRFATRSDGDDQVPENFESPATLCACAERKRSG